MTNFSPKHMGSLTKCVPAIWEIRGCVQKNNANLYISENVVAHRVPANLSIYAKKHHRCPVIYFLTDLKNMSSLESYDISMLGNICFRRQLQVQFVLEIQ